MLVNTIYGPMLEELLEKREVADKTATGVSNKTQYWLNGELVHQSIHFVFNDDYIPAMTGDATL